MTTPLIRCENCQEFIEADEPVCYNCSSEGYDDYHLEQEIKDHELQSYLIEEE